MPEDYLLPPYAPRVDVPIWAEGARLADSWAALRALLDGRDRSETLGRVIRGLLHVRHLFAFSSGGSALAAGLMALDLEAGDEVIMPSYLCGRVADAVLSAGLRPRLVDVGPDGNISPEAAEGAVTPKARAIVAAHLYGRPCDMVRLREIAARFDLYVVDDSAQALGATLDGRPAGNLGDIGILSFGPGKLAEGVGGGCLVSDRDDIAGRVSDPPPPPGRIGGLRRALDYVPERRLRRFAAPYRSWKRRNVQRAYGEPWQVRPPPSILPTAMGSLQGAVAVASLSGLQDQIRVRRSLAERLGQGLMGCGAMQLPRTAGGESHTAYPILIPSVHRYRVCLELSRAGIETLPPYFPLHLSRAYSPLVRPMLPLDGSERAFRHLVILPLHQAMEAHVEKALEILRAV